MEKWPLGRAENELEQDVLNLSLPQVTKTDFLLTTSIQYQAGR